MPFDVETDTIIIGQATPMQRLRRSQSVGAAAVSGSLSVAHESVADCAESVSLCCTQGSGGVCKQFGRTETTAVQSGGVSPRLLTCHSWCLTGPHELMGCWMVVCWVTPPFCKVDQNTMNAPSHTSGNDKLHIEHEPDIARNTTCEPSISTLCVTLVSRGSLERHP